MRPALTSLRFWLTLGAATVFSLAAFRAHAAGPTLSIVSPTSAQTLSTTAVTVKLAVSDFRLVDFQLYPRPFSGQGHVHLWLDQSNPTASSAAKAVTDSYTFENVKPGQHTLLAQLVANNHAPLVPPVTATVSFTTAPSSLASGSSLLAISLLAFLFLVIALYFVSQKTKSLPHSHTSPKKSAPSRSTRRRRK